VLGEARVGGHHLEVGQLQAAERGAQDGQRIEVVDRDAKEALDLWRMQVEGDDPVGACHLDGIGAHPGPDGHARLVLLVALGVAEVRHDDGHRFRAGPLQRVDPEQERSMK
jgi:hypothetical protein